MKYSHRIRVLGRELQVRSMTPPDRVREIEAFVNEKIAEAADSIRGGDLQVVAIVALMNLAESYLSLSTHLEELEKGNEDKIVRILRKFDELQQV